ncbi:hypothetical protein K439DRAFT_1647417 [Ramaria rubella]|nr:hypothetical protein K439DRAFT_1647417 [Ramaria rubella]
MRIIALPLTTRATNSRVSTNLLPLTYYHFQSPSHKLDDKGKQNIVKRATSKAAETWAGFGKAPDGNWKRKVFVYGEKLIDRIDFEELSLQGIDPSLGPRTGKFGRGKTEKAEEKLLLQIPVFYPPSVDLGDDSLSPLPHMQLFFSKRTPHHRKGFYIWLIIAPLTAPFALIPVIPNLPFFYAAWRAWSHYRAWKASAFMQNLIESNHVVPQPSPELAELYASNTSQRQHVDDKSEPGLDEAHLSLAKASSAPPQPRLLLSSDAIPRIVAIFELPESAGAGIVRAIEQARVRINTS